MSYLIWQTNESYSRLHANPLQIPPEFPYIDLENLLLENDLWASLASLYHAQTLPMFTAIQNPISFFFVIFLKIIQYSSIFHADDFFKLISIFFQVIPIRNPVFDASMRQIEKRLCVNWTAISPYNAQFSRAVANCVWHWTNFSHPTATSQRGACANTASGHPTGPTRRRDQKISLSLSFSLCGFSTSKARQTINVITIQRCNITFTILPDIRTAGLYRNSADTHKHCTYRRRHTQIHKHTQKRVACCT